MNEAQLHTRVIILSVFLVFAADVMRSQYLFADELETRVYAIGDLVVPMAKPPGASREEINAMIERESQALSKLITTTISPSSWEPRGLGNISFISEQNAFRITSSRLVHEKVATLVQRLRNLLSLQVCLRFAVFEVKESQAAEIVKLFTERAESHVPLEYHQAENLLLAVQDAGITIKAQQTTFTLLNQQTFDFAKYGQGIAGAETNIPRCQISTTILQDRTGVILKFAQEQVTDTGLSQIYSSSVEDYGGWLIDLTEKHRFHNVGRFDETEIGFEPDPNRVRTFFLIRPTILIPEESEAIEDENQKK